MYSDKAVVWVPVKRQNDSRTGGTPVIINTQTYIAGDDKHQEIKGDNVQEKGDRVILNRDGRTRVIDSEFGEIKASNLLIKCPNCDLRNEKDAKFCEKCGFELSKEAK